MAFVLDRMLSFQNPMRARLESGRFFVRFVVSKIRRNGDSIASAQSVDHFFGERSHGNRIPLRDFAGTDSGDRIYSAGRRSPGRAL